MKSHMFHLHSWMGASARAMLPESRSSSLAPGHPSSYDPKALLSSSVAQNAQQPRPRGSSRVELDPFDPIPTVCCCPVTKSCLTLCDPVNCSMPRFPVLHHLLEFAQTHVHWVNEAIQPSHPLSPPSPSALSLSQHQGLFQCVGSSHQ